MLHRIDEQRLPTVLVHSHSARRTSQQVDATATAGSGASHGHAPCVWSSNLSARTDSTRDAGMRSPAMIWPPARCAAVESGSAQRSSVTSTTPVVPGGGEETSSMSCSLSMPPTSASRSPSADVPSMASTSSRATEPSSSLTRTTRSRMRIAARSTSRPGGPQARQRFDVRYCHDEVLDKVGATLSSALRGLRTSFKNRPRPSPAASGIPIVRVWARTTPLRVVVTAAGEMTVPVSWVPPRLGDAHLPWPARASQHGGSHTSTRSDCGHTRTDRQRASRPTRDEGQPGRSRLGLDGRRRVRHALRRRRWTAPPRHGSPGGSRS